MKVVLDTNVVISACLKPGGLEAEVIEMARSGALELYVTQEVWEEYREVFARRKFRGIREVSERLLGNLEPVAKTVLAKDRVTEARDEDDNRFLECAAAAGADFLITGNLRHYPEAFESVRIMNARSFLVTLGRS